MAQEAISRSPESHSTEVQMRPTADQLNERLRDGGFVQVTTYTRSVIYKKQHAGMFREKEGNLQVQRGKSWDTLSLGDRLLVGIRTGRLAKVPRKRAR